MLMGQAFGQIESVVLWGLVGTVVMTIILQGSQGLGLSRLSLPFILGTFLSGQRSWAAVLGLLWYFLGGWFFAFFYYLIFLSLNYSSWWLGGLLGLLHALFLLIVMLPVLPYIHPRMATEYDGPVGLRRLEPPGFMGLNYGHRTPLTTLVGHTAYGLILGVFLHVPAI